MSEVITFEEMQHRYDGEWLLIAPEEVDEDLQVIKAEVLAHSPLQEDIYQVLQTVEEQPLAIEYSRSSPRRSRLHPMSPKKVYRLERQGELLFCRAAVGRGESNPLLVSSHLAPGVPTDLLSGALQPKPAQARLQNPKFSLVRAPSGRRFV